MSDSLILRWRLPPSQPSPVATIVGPRGARGDTRSYAVPVGDGVSTLFQVDHELGTRNVVVGVRRNNAGGADVIADVRRPDTNHITVEFRAPPATDEFVVTVLG